MSTLHLTQDHECGEELLGMVKDMAAPLLEQHHRDSKELRSLCKARDQAKRERDKARRERDQLKALNAQLLEAVKTFAEWLRREETGFPGSRGTSDEEAAWREWYDGNLALCRLAQDQASAVLAKATGAQQ